MYKNFDNFKEDYLDKIYQKPININTIGDGIYKTIDNSINCCLKSFYLLDSYKQAINDVINNRINSITGEHFMIKQKEVNRLGMQIDENITQISKYLNQCIAEKNTKQCEKYFEYLKKYNELIEKFKKYNKLFNL